MRHSVKFCCLLRRKKVSGLHKMRNRRSASGYHKVSTKKRGHSSTPARRRFMKKLSTITLMLAVLLRWAVPAIAQGPGMGGPRSHHMMGDGFGLLLPPFLLRKLNLSDDQKTKVQGIMEEYHATVPPLFQQ